MRSNKNSSALVLLGIEHKRFHQVLDLLEQQIQLLDSGGTADRKLLDLVIDYFLDFPDACHHPKEDLLFARVMAQLPNDQGEVGDLIGEHRELSRLTHQVREWLDAVPRGDTLPESARSALKTFLQFYREHIATENQQFFPFVMEHLSQQDLDLIDFDLFDKPDPVYDGQVEGRFKQLRAEILSRGETG